MTQKRALIVWGGWDGHTPEKSARVVAEMLQADGFEVTVSNTTRAFADPALGDLNLVVPVITMSTIEKDEVANLSRAVEGGTGLAGFHGCMCDSFRNEVDYQFMTGANWVAHPGDIIDFTVNVARPDDPVMRGIADFPYRSEQYYMHVDPANEVLATTTFSGAHCAWVEGVVMPVVWKRRHGAGRVFYSALGHTVEEFKLREMATIFRRGALWAAGGNS